jgi:hypothetical protein
MAACQNEGRASIAVRVVEAPGDTDLYAEAFECNRLHGKALTLDDRRAFADHLLRQDPQTSNLEVSRRTGLAPTTVASIRERLEDESSISPTARSVT